MTGMKTILPLHNVYEEEIFGHLTYLEHSVPCLLKVLVVTTDPFLRPLVDSANSDQRKVTTISLF